MSNQKPFKWRHFQSDIILLCVRWYLRYSLSYRDLEEIMLERGLHVDHTTIYRWVQCYAPELERRCRPHLKPTTDSWRVDETYIKVKKEWMYLYRAVDSEGKTLDFWLSPTRDGEAAKRFFLKTLAASHMSSPRVINVDKNAAYPKAFAVLKAEGYIPEHCTLRQVKYRGNLVEQDHRAHQTLDEAWDGLFLVRDHMENDTRIRGDEYDQERTDTRYWERRYSLAGRLHCSPLCRSGLKPNTTSSSFCLFFSHHKFLQHSPLIREVLEPLRLTTPTHRFVLQLESTSPTCLGARDKLAQVLSNLLSNAIKYSPDGGAVVVGSQVVQEMAQVWVQDEGIGIPQKPWKQCLSPIVGLRQAPRAISKAQVSASLLLASSSRCKEDASGSKVAWGRVHVFPLPSRSPDSIRRKEEYMIVIRFRRNLGHLSVIFIRFQGKGWKSVVHLFHV